MGTGHVAKDDSECPDFSVWVDAGTCTESRETKEKETQTEGTNSPIWEDLCQQVKALAFMGLDLSTKT